MNQQAIPTIPNKLYGRDRDIITLLESFERISSGQGEVMLVSGSSGVGKTALVHELQLPVRGRNGFFISGKFDQYQQNVPYFAFRQALAALCQELLAGDTQQCSRFKADILRAIGNQGQVLVDLVPEFAALLGAQPPLGDISPQEARHRFADVFVNFLKVICRPEHPLVLFIDDWQWADAASFELLKQIHAGITLRHLLVIVSFRDNEVGLDHPLVATVNDLKVHAVSVQLLLVKNITVDDVREIVADALQPTAEEIEGLAAFIHGKTVGNPFFVRSLLSYLQEFNFVWFDNDRNLWQWRLDKTGGAALPDNVVDLFVLKLRRLDSASQKLFSLAACLGNRFDLQTLGIISSLDHGECLALLFSTQAKDILLPVVRGVGISPAADPVIPKSCTFLHDRLQQAAYMLIDPAELPGIHLEIGRLLLLSLPPLQLEERLFEVVNHLNAGFDLIEEIAEQVTVLELNIAAARKAFVATAYSAALQFYRAAARFLEIPGFTEQLWCNYHDLAMSLFKEKAECEFLEGNRHEAEECIQHSVAHSRTALEKADVFRILIVQYTLLAKYPEAIAAGRQALSVLGISLPEEEYEKARNSEIAQVRRELGNRTVSTLIDLPLMSDPEMLMAAKILITMGPPCYRSHQRLWGVIVPKVINLTLRYGNIPQVGYSHTAFGGLLGWVDNDYATAQDFGELATRLMTETFRSPSDQSVFYLMIGSSIRHWFKHLMYSTQDYTDAYEIGMRSGNLQYAAYAFGHNMYCRFYQGVPLAGLIQETQRSLEFSRSRCNQWAIDLLEGGLNIFGALASESVLLNEPGTRSEEDYLRRVEGHQNIQVTCIYKVLKTFSLLLSGDYDLALQLSDEAEPLIYTVGTQGLLPWPEHVFARLLIITALYLKADEERQVTWHAELDRMISRLRIWAENCPDNFEHKYLLAAAEIARIDGRQVEAITLYDKAIEAAQAGNFLQWEGMANERAHCFWLECGNERLAHVYWQQAYICYAKWGAVDKVCSMETAYRTYLATVLPLGLVSGNPVEQPEQGSINALAEKQIKQLRTYASQIQQNSLRIEAVAQAGELADAMQRLRVEIAERKQMEKALRTSEARFKAMFNEAPLGIALINSLTGHIYNANPMFAKIAGRTMEEMAHIDWMSITHPDDIQKDLDNMALLNAGEINGFQMDKRYLHYDGAAVWISMTIAKVDVEDKEYPCHLCMIEEITERIMHEKELLAKNTELERFNYTVSHDLKSPLITIQTYAGMILNDIQTGKLARAHDDLKRIEAAAAKMTALLDDLIVLSRAGQIMGPAVQVDMNRVINDTLLQLAGPLKQNHAEIVVQPDLPAVFGDQKRIAEVVQNLIENAIKYMGDQPLPLIEIGTRQDFTECVFFVRDNGKGIEPRYHETVFDLFNKLDEKSEGTGVGLALVKRIVEVHGGRVWVESEGAGQGSTFCFTVLQ